jgi:hypothetical protein
VVVRKQSTARNGQTVVALVNRGRDDQDLLQACGTPLNSIPPNAAMRPFVITSKDEFSIEGILVGVIRHCGQLVMQGGKTMSSPQQMMVERVDELERMIVPLEWPGSGNCSGS